jgi:hypothetical protein
MIPLDSTFLLPLPGLCPIWLKYYVRRSGGSDHHVGSFVRPDWTGGDEDLEKAIQQAQREKDTKAWKVLIQARTVRNNVAKVRAWAEQP